MSKEYLEALERVANNLEHHYPIRDFNTIKQALQRLNAIENSKPSKAIECLERIDIEYSTIESEDFDICYNIIKHSLLKAQELENRINIETETKQKVIKHNFALQKERDKYKRVLDIIFEKPTQSKVAIAYIKTIINPTYEDYCLIVIDEHRLTEDEFNSLKALI